MRGLGARGARRAHLAEKGVLLHFGGPVRSAPRAEPCEWVAIEEPREDIAGLRRQRRRQPQRRISDSLEQLLAIFRVPCGARSRAAGPEREVW